MKRHLVSRALALAAVAAAAAPLAAAEQILDGIAAQVGPDIVLVSEVMQMVGPMEAELRAVGAPESEIAKLRAEGLERMIEWRLIERVVRQTELYASDEQIDSAIEAIASDNGISREQLEASVVGHGVELGEYRTQIKREIERSRVMAAMVSSKVHVDEAEVRRLYRERFSEQPEGGEQVHLRQILLTFGGDTGRSREDACRTVARALERVAAGEPFPQVGRENNDMAPARGGDVGWMHVDTLAPTMVALVNGLEPGQTSSLVELPFGCSILQLVDRRAYAYVTYEMAHDALERELFVMREAERYREWIDKLRENIYIERRGHFAQASSFADGDAAPRLGD